MAKSREHIVANGRAVFYAAIWNDFRQAALDCGWALGLHGSLNSDMDIMAMAWIEDAKPIDEMIKALENCLVNCSNELITETKVSNNKPNNRVVYTIHIFADFYLDINIVSQESESPQPSAPSVSADDIFNEAVIQYCSPFGKPNPETYSFIAGAKWMQEYAQAQQGKGYSLSQMEDCYVNGMDEGWKLAMLELGKGLVSISVNMLPYQLELAGKYISSLPTPPNQ